MTLLFFALFGLVSVAVAGVLIGLAIPILRHLFARMSAAERVLALALYGVIVMVLVLAVVQLTVRL